MIILVPTNAIAIYWPSVWRLLGDALKKSGASQYAKLSDIRRCLESGEQSLVVVIDPLDGATMDKIVKAACTLRVGQHPEVRECEVLLIGGSGMKDWGGVLWCWIQDFARRHGCSLVSGGGRKEWGAWFKRYAHGRKVTARTIYTVEVSHG